MKQFRPKFTYKNENGQVYNYLRIHGLLRLRMYSKVIGYAFICFLFG
jgi:hypothetical protein